MSVQTHKKTTTTYRTVNMASPEQTATTYRTLSMASPEPTTTTTTYRTLNVASPEPTATTYRTLSVASADPQVNTVISASSLPYAVNNGSYDVRYLVPMQQQQQQQYVYLQQPMMQQPMMQQMVQPVYLQSVQGIPHVGSTCTHDSDFVYQQRQTLESTSGKSSVFSQSSSPIKSPERSFEEEEYEEDEEAEEEEEVEVEEVEIVNVIQQRPSPLIERTQRVEIKSRPPLINRTSRTEVHSSLQEAPEPTKLDTRYFGELLAEVYRKNCDIHSCISEHVSKIKGKKMDIDFRVDRDDVEALIPKGATELTKQQMRYLLQTRLTADKSMRLLLSTFSSLREELLHMSEDLRRLDGDKEALERDLAFKVDQAKQYDTLLENVRENNRQLQSSLKEVTASQRSLETQLMSSKTSDSSRDFKMKELEGRMRVMEKENDMLRQKLAGQVSGASLQKKTEELSQQYNEQLGSMREEKDREIEKLRSQMSSLQTKITSSTTTTSTTQSSNERSLQLKISELLSMLDQRQTTITQQEMEIKKLLQDRNNSSKNTTQTIITKRYNNKYPMLGLLSDNYQVSSPVIEDRTVVIKRTDEMRKQQSWNAA